jgi:hypothetical protein
MAFRDVVTHIKPAVVGMGMLADEHDPISVVIFGTGFIVDRSGWIMTNRHVAENFIAERNGVIGVRNALARAVLFVDSTGREIHTTGKKATAGRGLFRFQSLKFQCCPFHHRGQIHHVVPFTMKQSLTLPCVA